MDARSALFDRYGDHLRSRGAQAPVAALVRLLGPLGITAPAVRTAVSRMAGQGWLEAVRLADGAGYALTPRALRRLAEAAELFEAESARLLPTAARFVDCCLRSGGAGRPDDSRRLV